MYEQPYFDAMFERGVSFLCANGDRFVAESPISAGELSVSADGLLLSDACELIFGTDSWEVISLPPGRYPVYLGCAEFYRLGSSGFRVITAAVMQISTEPVHHWEQCPIARKVALPEGAVVEIGSGFACLADATLAMGENRHSFENDVKKWTQSFLVEHSITMAGSHTALTREDRSIYAIVFSPGDERSLGYVWRGLSSAGECCRLFVDFGVLWENPQVDVAIEYLALQAGEENFVVLEGTPASAFLKHDKVTGEFVFSVRAIQGTLPPFTLTVFDRNGELVSWLGNVRISQTDYEERILVSPAQLLDSRFVLAITTSRKPIRPEMSDLRDR